MKSTIRKRTNKEVVDGGYILFYAGLIYARYGAFPWRTTSKIPEEVLQGGIVYCIGYTASQWYTCDGCPLLIDDVPNNLKATVLLLT